MFGFDFFKNKQSEFELCSTHECEHATRPRGAHCNYQGIFLQPYQPKLLATDICNLKDFLLSNPSGTGLTKLSTIFPEEWSPTEITTRVLEAISSENKKIVPMHRFGILKIVAYTQEQIEIIAFYHIEKKSLALFYPNFQE